MLGRKKWLFFIFFYLYRRGIIPVIILSLYSYPVMQITMVLGLQLSYMVFIMNERVFRSPSE